MKSATILLAFGLIFAVTAAKVDYSGHMVIRTVPKTEDQLDFLAHLQHSTSMDFWDLPGKVNDEPAVIRVSPESYYQVARSLAEQGLDHTITITDLGELERKEQQAIALRRAVFGNDKAFDLANYHTYDEIMTYLNELVAAKPSLVSKKVASQRTHEGREIVQLTISSGGTNKSVVFLECNIHAREWISSATCLWIIDTLVNGYGTDSEITRLVDAQDWKFVPITNPDGHVHSWNSDRLWRKNRVPNAGGTCFGVDVNRNFEAGFGLNGGSSTVGCSDTFRGTGPFSEQESQAIRELVEADKGRIKAALSIHSYSQVWLSPYGYQSSLPSDYAEMERAMKVGVDALTATSGTRYTYGSTSNLLYIASGVATDYYYANLGVVHSYTIELRDTGTYGFELPPSQIVPTATETWNGIKAFVNVI